MQHQLQGLGVVYDSSEEHYHPLFIMSTCLPLPLPKFLLSTLLPPTLSSYLYRPFLLVCDVYVIEFHGNLYPCLSAPSLTVRARPLFKG